MQRKDIDEEEYADLEAGMIDPTISEGEIRIVSGNHALHGAMILVSASGSYAVLGNDIRYVPGLDETVETDLAA